MTQALSTVRPAPIDDPDRDPVGSRYAPDADFIGTARLLVDAGAKIEFKDIEMATQPLSNWLASAVKSP